MVIVRAALLDNTQPDSEWATSLAKQLRTVTVDAHPASAGEVYLVLTPVNGAHPAAADKAAADLILRPESSEMQRAQASVFLEQAQAIQKEPAADPPEYELGARVAQRREQRDVERTQGPRSVLDATANHPRHDITHGPNVHLRPAATHTSVHHNPAGPTR